MEKGHADRHVLTITGSDGTGGAGIQSDIMTIAELGGLPLTAITTVTMQNTLGIQEFFDLPANVLEQQVEAIMDDISPDVVKIGMLRNEGQVKAVVRMLKRYAPRWIVYDPVGTTTRGERLYSEELSEEITHTLLPMCHIVVRDLNVQSLVDWERHGMRSIFSASIAAYLAQGMTKENAVSEAAAYVNRQAALAGNIEGRGAELYNELLNLIAEYHESHSDVQYYADKMNVSSRYLAQVTKRMAGISPKSLIDEYLLKHIKIALQSTDRTIQEIAWQFSFTSQSHFTKFFKKMTGETPTEYRGRQE
ncbi:hydroxymethylpyrimidine/phosphomethylpyrimidine kinase [Prevotella sp. OH937_COT-195]|uniref:hydroxymethylpyrimidine/phosphomethylpyrimidine kinase n=1 Tax=Prevotella sp. OH937_COT-195 TaxID=2491051 RepID=UPI0013155D68|nr:hydroxymethylpyrimidine/phosphomethylpyrimidine kinase [Prevotella sp. OH937_COT-195]